jgi:hypothetical protein
MTDETIAAKRSVGNIARPLDNGIAHEKRVTHVTHLAFCGGWPVAHLGVPILRKAFADAGLSWPGSHRCRSPHRAATTLVAPGTGGGTAPSRAFATTARRAGAYPGRPVMSWIALLMS